MEFLILKFLYPPTERHAAALNGNKALGEQVGARAPRLLFPERHTRKPRTSRATKMVHECNYRKEKGTACRRESVPAKTEVQLQVRAQEVSEATSDRPIIAVYFS
jgi:hypothetical protein